MLSFLRENRRILLCTALALVAGMLLGYALRLPGVQPEEQEDAAPVDRIGEAAVLPETRVEREICYLRCNHTDTVQMADTSAVVGLTRRELAAKYPDAVITSFSSELVRLVMSVDGYCPEHLVLQADAQNVLEVYRMQEDTLEMRSVLRLEHTLDGFDAETVAELQQGVLFHTLDEINHYLESMES